MNNLPCLGNKPTEFYLKLDIGQAKKGTRFCFKVCFSINLLCQFSELHSIDQS